MKGDRGTGRELVDQADELDGERELDVAGSAPDTAPAGPPAEAAAPAPPAAPAPASAAALILPNDRHLFVGKTGSGKSTAGTVLWSRLVGAGGPQGVVVDPKDEWHVRGAARVSRPRLLELALREHRLIHYVPSEDSVEEWEAVYAHLFESRRARWVRGGLIVLTDEATSMTTGNRAPRGLKLIQTQGRGLGIGHLAMTQRPRDISRVLITEAEHVWLFGPPLVLDDLTSIARELGRSREDVRELIGELPPHGMLWWNRRADSLTYVEPLPAHLLNRSLVRKPRGR